MLYTDLSSSELVCLIAYLFGIVRMWRHGEVRRARSSPGAAARGGEAGHHHGICGRNEHQHSDQTIYNEIQEENASLFIAQRGIPLKYFTGKYLYDN